MSSEILKLQKIPSFFPAILISAAIIILWLIPVLVISLRGVGWGSGPWGVFSIIALIVTIIAPVAYGWHTKDTTGAVIIGIFPFLLTITIPRIFFVIPVQDTDLLIRSALYLVALCSIGGLEGYFAAKREIRSFVIAAALAGLWAMVFLSGIN
jgi:hypothetical protein